MPINKSVNTFTGGLNIATNKTKQPKDTYSYALNAIKEDCTNDPDNLSNERGFTEYLDLGYNYVLLGSIYLGLENYVLFIKNITDESAFNRIILYRNEVVTIVYDTVNLNFQEKYIIKGTYRINYKNEVIIYFVDGLNEDRVLNIDNGLATGNVDELAIDIRYVPAIVSSVDTNDDGGSLLTGTYEFYGSYKTADNATTPWFLLTANPIYIIDDNTQVTSNYVSIDGSDSKLPTNKAIILNISDLDNTFKTLRIGVIKTYNGVSTGVYVDNIFFSEDTLTYYYTGNSSEIQVSEISEFTVDRVKYFASNAIIQMDNRLLRANNKSSKIDINYQSFANNIITNYTIEEELVGSMQDSTDYNVRALWWQSANTKYSTKKSLMRDEVYSVGIAFGLIAEGVESEVYHIPARAIDNIPSTTYKNQYDDSATLPYSSTWDSAPITENGQTVPTWQVKNTALLSDDGTIKKPAYWESSNIYPDGFDLPTTGSSTNGVNNTKVRHHKMPSAGLEPIFRTDTSGGTISFYKRHIGLSFSNIIVPEAIKSNIAYIRIYISPRTTDQNKSIIAKGIFTNCSLTKVNINDFDTVSDVLYIIPCEPYNDQEEITNGNCYKAGQDDGWNAKTNHYHSFYSPDTTLKQSVLDTNRVLIENEFTGIVQYYNTIASHINADPYHPGDPGTRDSASNGGYKRDLFYDDSNDGGVLPTGQTSTGAIYNISPGNFRSTYKSIAILNNTTKVHNSLSRRRLKQAVYVPFNANLSTDQLGGMDNPYNSAYGSSNVVVELNPTYDILGETQTEDTSVRFTDNNPSDNWLDPEMDDDLTGTFHMHTIINPTVVYRYGSLKKDNSGQYGNIIDGIEYNPTDLVIANPTFNGDNLLTDACTGLIGDTWIDMFSVKRTRFTQKEYYTFAGKPEISIGISTFFTEANLNTRLRYAEGTDSRVYYPKQILTTPIKQYLDAGFNLPILTSDNYYKENPDFDKQVTKKNFGVSGIDKDLSGIIQYITRIIYSEKLLDETRVDSYRTFLANNYRDLPKNTGFITHLFKKSQELYSITRDSLWKLFASSNSFKSDSTTVTVGTGDFLSLEPLEVLSIEGGYGGSSSKLSLVESPYGYFYIDKNKGKFILFNEQEKDLSLIGISNFIKDNFKLNNPDIIDFDLPLLNSGYIAGYDPELKRILITKLEYSLTTEQLSNFKGEFNPSTTYTVGDIYIRDGQYYVFDASTPTYVTIDQGGTP